MTLPIAPITLTAAAVATAGGPAAPPTAVPASAAPSGDAVIDGVNVDAIARAVQACAGVSGLAGGRFGEVASYLPGRRVPGVTIETDAVEIQVKARWGVPARDLFSQITSVLAPVVDRRIDVVVADIDDPPPSATARPVLEGATIPAAGLTAELPAATPGGSPLAL